MNKQEPRPENDPRFPSGRWVGFWIQHGKYHTEVKLRFTEGVISGEGKDWVGAYSIQGRYGLEDGRCFWNKRYLDAHDVLYEGFNDGRGIWGTWSFPHALEEHREGFHIWPEDMPDPSDSVEEVLKKPPRARRSKRTAD